MDPNNTIKGKFYKETVSRIIIIKTKQKQKQKQKNNHPCYISQA